MISVNQISGNIVDVLNRKTYPGTIYIENGKISRIEKQEANYDQYIMPGFVDAHVHVESSMLTPCEFARLAMPHGTVASVSDPHEIANVLGLKGVEYMIENGLQSPFKFFFGAPSCVPATTFETAGAVLTLADIESLFQRSDIKYLSEMMNFPGVLFEDPEVMAKIELAKKYGRKIDGHAPGLRGEDAKKYISAGITTDHECFTLEEALDKLQYGMKIAIREGSAAKNFEALASLVDSHTDNTFFCSDDKHPNDLVVGHINELILRALAKGSDLMDVLQCACINPVQHYGLEVGLLQEGDTADFLVVNNLEEIKILQTYVDGQLVAEDGKCLLAYQSSENINHFNTSEKKVTDFAVRAKGNQIRVIEALEGQLITNELIETALIEADFVVSDTSRDILKLTVVNRYSEEAPEMAFIKNFGFQHGAIASTVAHDSHNIIAVGVSDEAICEAVNLLIQEEGGLSVVTNETSSVLPLPIAGLMTPNNGYEVAKQYTLIDELAKSLGTTLHSPYMTLSFMALLVIPSLKLSDKGLFNGQQFAFTSLFISDTDT